MGLYDSIIFDRSLIQGLDERMDKYLALVSEGDINLQTKNFDCGLNSYYVQDGKLFFEDVESEFVQNGEGFWSYNINEIRREKRFFPTTQTIRAYDLVQSEPFDVWIELEMVFIEGMVNKITVAEYSETDSAPRIQREKEWAQKLKNHHEFRNSFRGKLYVPTSQFAAKILRKFSALLRKGANFIDKITFKL
jgi:hypothetical protein